jgi:hypothetical protein
MTAAFETWWASEDRDGYPPKRMALAAWKDALERAAQVCEEYGDLTAAEKDSALLVGKVDLSNAMSGEPRAADFLAKAIRGLIQPATPKPFSEKA